jgi:hypothetical protein
LKPANLFTGVMLLIKQAGTRARIGNMSQFEPLEWQEKHRKRQQNAAMVLLESKNTFPSHRAKLGAPEAPRTIGDLFVALGHAIYTKTKTGGEETSPHRPPFGSFLSVLLQRRHCGRVATHGARC